MPGNFIDSDGVELANKYVTKEYIMNWNPDLMPNMQAPQLFTWGINTAGQLGDGTVTARSSPGTTAGGGTNWKQPSGGHSSGGGIKTDGTLWTWGVNTRGEIGDGTTTSRSSPGTTAGGGTSWRQASCGYRFSSAIKTDGVLWTWGFANYGALGDGTQIDKSSPVTTAGGGTNWKQVSSGYLHAAAVKTDGTLWTWGYGGNGRLGDNAFTGSTSPGTTVGGGTNWKQVACGYGHCAAIKTDGTLWIWGYNFFYSLGDGTQTDRASPVTTAGGGTNWKQVAGHLYSVAAVKTDGTLWTWGRNNSGQLGDGTSTNRSSPITVVGGGVNWKQVDSGSTHTVAVKTDGTLWTWGSNGSGELGTGNLTARSSPGTTIAGGTNWKQVTAGNNLTQALSESEGW